MQWQKNPFDESEDGGATASLEGHRFEVVYIFIGY